VQTLGHGSVKSHRAGNQQSDFSVIPLGGVLCAIAVNVKYRMA
jgi:hypothetical protein